MNVVRYQTIKNFMKKIPLIIIIIIFLAPSVAYAKPSQEIIEKRTDEIYQACKNEDLIIKKGILKNATTREKITEINWPWEKDKLFKIVELFGEREPYIDYKQCSSRTAFVYSDQIDGCEILKCGEHILDISDTKYLLDGVEISTPQDIQNLAYNNKGNIIQGSSINNVEQNINTEKENFWLSYIYPAISSIILGLVLHLIIYPNSKQNSRIKEILVSICVMIVLSYLIVLFIKFFV